MLRSMRRINRTFNWDVVIRLALVPVVTYVLMGAALSGGRRTVRAAETLAGTATWLVQR